VHYNKKPGVDHSLRGPECSASDLIIPVELPKYVISEGTKAVTKVTSADVILSLALYEISVVSERHLRYSETTSTLESTAQTVMAFFIP
jgi:hypothetical protein